MTEGNLTLRSFAVGFLATYGVNLSKSTLSRYFVAMGRHMRNSYVKPELKPKHYIARLNFIINKCVDLGGGNWAFRDERLTLHADEKWFYLMPEVTRKREFEETGRFADRSTRHKSHIEKVMFLCVVGCPHFLADGTWWDGKIGMFPLTTTTLAKKTSVNRPAGAEVIKTLNITSAVYLETFCKVGGVFEKIREKMPWAQNDKITVQHDGAPAHEGQGNWELLPVFGQQGGWNIAFETQPAQSPDLNKCDLCIFNSLQKASNELRGNQTSIPALIASVMAAWDQYDSAKLVRVHAHLREVYRCVLGAHGGNQYKKSHSGITHRQLVGEEVCNNAVDFLQLLDARVALDNLLNAL